MSMIEKFQESKKKMYGRFDEIRKQCDEAIDMAGKEFLEEFKAMIAGASEEEFYEFMCGDNGLDEVERFAALTARFEAREKKHVNKRQETNEREDRFGDDAHIFVIGIR